MKSPGIFQYVASLENEHDSFREVHLSLVYVWSFMTFRSFVYKLQSFKLSATFAFVLYHHDNAPSHTSLKAMAKLDHDYDSNWLLTRLGDLPAIIICSQTSSGGSGERDSHRMRKSSRKPRRISKAWTFRTTERASKCWKIAIPSVSPSKATVLRNKYNFVQKTLVFIKNPGTFQPM